MLQVLIRGTNLSGATVSFSGTGITTNPVFGGAIPRSNSILPIRIAISAGALTGQRTFIVTTPAGTVNSRSVVFTVMSSGTTPRGARVRVMPPVTAPPPAVNPPVASFNATPQTGEAPLTVRFTDTSTGATSWIWSIVGGIILSIDQDVPPHVFENPGTYTVGLNVGNQMGRNQTTKDIVVLPPSTTTTATSPPGGGTNPVEQIIELLKQSRRRERRRANLDKK